jgi:hypothetical protein
MLLTLSIMKLPGHRSGLPGKVISFNIVLLDPAYKAELVGHVPVKDRNIGIVEDRS